MPMDPTAGLPRAADDPLVAELESMVTAELARDDGMAPGPCQSEPDETQPDLPKRFTVLGLIGAGSMGRVYDAQDEVLRRRVAIKVLSRRGAVAAELIRREREVLAALQHPGIVAIHDCGELPDGRPYFVMQQVEGEDLRAFVRSRGLTRHEIARLMAIVCRSVGTAHLLHIVHRDLKPKNIKVTPGGQPMVLDFGLAQFAREPAGEPGVDFQPRMDVAANVDSPRALTFGSIQGTVAYMSPEQAGGDAVDARTDVYALGVILHGLFVGKLPVDPKEASVALHEWSDYLRAHQPRACRELTRLLPQDLAAIIDRCLALDPDKRYANAMELAEELEAFSAGRPVRAVNRRRWWYVTRKFARLHAKGLAAAGAAGAVLVATVALSFHRVRQERNVAIRERERAEDREAVARPFVHASKTRQAHLAWRAQRLDEALGLLESSDLTGSGLAGFDWFFLRRQCDKRPVLLAGHRAPVGAFALSPDGRTLVSGDARGSLFVWNGDKGEVSLVLEGHREEITGLAVDWARGLVASASTDETVRLWRLSTGERIQTLSGLGEPINAVAWGPADSSGPSRSRLAAVDKGGKLLVWESEGDTSPRVIDAHDGRAGLAVDFSPDGEVIVTGGKDHAGRVFDARSYERVADLVPNGGPVWSVRFTPSGDHVATAGWDRTLRHWDRRDGYRMSAINPWGAEASIIGIQFDGAGDKEYLGLANGRVPIGPAPPRAGSDQVVRLEPDSMRAFAVSGDGATFVSVGGAAVGMPSGEASADGTVIKRSRRADLEECRRHATPIPIERLALLADGERLALVGQNAPEIRVVRTRDGELVCVLAGHDSAVSGISAGMHADAPSLLSVDVDGVVIEWDMDRMQEARRAPRTKTTLSLALAPDGATYALGGIGIVEMRERVTGALKWRQQGHGHFAVSDICFTPDGQYLVSGCWDNGVKVWEAAGGRLVRALVGADDAVFRVAVSPDGRLVAASGRSGSVVVWDLVSGARRDTFAQSNGPSVAVRFSPDNRLLAVGTRSNREEAPAPVILWDLATRIETLVLRPPARAIGDLVFTDNGRTLVGAGASSSPEFLRAEGSDRAAIAGTGGIFLWESLVPGRTGASGE